jgi:biphenyl 2,3-dioxygenase beta subunit
MTADLQLQHEVEQFYYDEAAMLDERRFSEWPDLFTDDVHYWMPIRRTLTSDQIDREFTNPGEMALFDETKSQLEARVRKLETGYSWSEDPPSRTRHVVYNVRVVGDDGTELSVDSGFILYRSRYDADEDTWVGTRKDTLRRVDGSLKIAKRTILMDHTVILSKNLSNFF